MRGNFPVNNMNEKRIIFKTENGGVAVMTPCLDCGLTVEEIAAKDVPEGAPFQIVDAADIPTDRTFRDEWQWAAIVEKINQKK
jgi:hypothetical protein